MARCCTPTCSLHYQIVMSIIGLVAGIIAFAVFDFYYENYHAGSWGLVGAIISAANLHLHLCFKYNRLHIFYSERLLTIMVFVGATIAVASGIAAITYLTVSAIEHIPMMPADKSLIMGTTQSFLAFKYGIAMSWFSRKYSKTLQHEYGLVE